MGNICWSDIYQMSAVDRDLVVEYIKQDHYNYQVMIDACSVILNNKIDDDDDTTKGIL
jgi:hypothetical protein